MSTLGPVQKMKVTLADPVLYEMPIGDELLPMNDRIGERLRLHFHGEIRCINCDRKINKSYQQGYCYPCFTRLAQTDDCIIRPELCHYQAGTCREPKWGEEHCLIPHTVYLANSSGLKVGITRGLDPSTRWIDQGAHQALAIRIARDRLESGRVEVALKKFVSDRTNWRAMLKGDPEPRDLEHERERLLEQHRDSNPDEPLPGRAADEARPVTIRYPVSEYPTKVVSHNLDKKPLLEGTLHGIKGQYLILDTAVINIRKYGGYVIEVS